jgi:enoyl-[acyl-carrier protein] reductase II
VVEARDACTVSVDKWMVVGRDLKNSFTDKYFEMKAAGASMEELWQYISEHSMYRGLVQGDVDEGKVPCGQNAGIIDNIVSAAEVIHNLMSGIASVFGQLKARIPTR